jgi:hypothetical protein
MAALCRDAATPISLASPKLDAGGSEELFQIVAAINDAGVEEG